MNISKRRHKQLQKYNYKYDVLISNNHTSISIVVTCVKRFWGYRNYLLKFDGKLSPISDDDYYMLRTTSTEYCGLTLDDVLATYNRWWRCNNTPVETPHSADITVVYGTNSHAEGYCKAGQSSHAEGYYIR